MKWNRALTPDEKRLKTADSFAQFQRGALADMVDKSHKSIKPLVHRARLNDIDLSVPT